MANAGAPDEVSTRLKLSLKRKRNSGKDKHSTDQTHKRILLAPKLKSDVIIKLSRCRSSKAENADGAHPTSTDSGPESQTLGGCRDDFGQEATGLGDLFFCHICQKDLTSFDLARRQQHINRCCDSEDGGHGVKGEEVKGEDNGSQEVEQFLCVICQKKFGNDQAKIAHMKSCAKQRGISTVELLNRFKGHKEEEGGSSVGTKKQRDLKSVLRSSDKDFKEPPQPPTLPSRRTRKRKKKEISEGLFEEMEHEQLQLGLALSASLEGEGLGTAQLSTASERKSKTRGRKHPKLNKETLPLLTVSSQRARDIIASRAAQLLRPAVVGGGAGQEEEEEEISCTPSFGSSSLAGGSSVVRGRAEGSHGEVVGGAEGSHGEVVGGAGGSGEGAEVYCGDEDELLLAVEQNEEGNLQEQDEDEILLLDPREKDNVLDGNESSWDVNCGNLKREEMVSNMEGQGEECGAVQADGGEVTSTSTLCVSFAEEMQGVAYPTLWGLGSCDLTSEGLSDFYVPALAPIITPSKHNPLCCKKCDSEVCVMNLALSQSPGSSKTAPPEPCKEDQVATLLSDMASLINSPLLSDLTILASGGTQLRAHGCILAARCPGFRQAVVASPTPPRVLDLSEFSSESVLAYLETVYCASADWAALDEQTRKELEAISSRMCSSEKNECIRYHDATPSPGGGDNATPSPGDRASTSSGVSCSILTVCPGPVQDDNATSSPGGGDSATPSPGGGDSATPSPRGGDSATPSPGGDRGSTSSGASCSVVAVHPGPVQDPPSPGRGGNATPSPGGADNATPSPGGNATPSPGGDRGSTSSGTSCCVVAVHPGPMWEDNTSEDMDRPSGDLTEVTDLEVIDDVVSLSSSEASREVAEQSTDLPTQQNTLAELNVVETKGISCRSQSEASGSALCEENSRQSDSKYDSIFKDWVEIESPTPSSSLSRSSPTPTLTPPLPTQPALSPPTLHMNSAPLSTTDTIINSLPPPESVCSRFTTPAAGGGCLLLSEDNITPTPKYNQLHTPQLKEQCARYGVKPLAKRKMIAKLKEIYNYTHPLVAEDGSIVPEVEHGEGVATKKPSNAKTISKDPNHIQQVKAAITSDQQLYQDILLYKPLELGLIQTKLKSAGLSLSKDKLADILDFMCVTFIEPRNRNPKKIVTSGR